MSIVEELEALNDDCFKEYQKLIHDLTGIKLSSARKTMLQGRLRKRILSLKLAGHKDYLGLLKKSQEEVTIFIDLVTTNETQFYRTPRIWNYIEQVYLPEWHRTHAGKVFQAWSAASSSGEEAYSLAIACQEFKQKHSGFAYSILGTDISQKMVGLCRQGLYEGKSIDAFQKTRPEIFAKHMKPVDRKVQPDSDLRARVKFQRHNLFEKFDSRNSFDLILVRNVLIYFEAADQEKVLRNLYSNLAPDGLLIIGESESLSHIKTGFSQVEPLIYKIKETPSTKVAA